MLSRILRRIPTLGLALPTRVSTRSFGQLSLLWCLLLLGAIPGCSALRPLKGVPAAKLPDEYKPISRSLRKPISLNLLRQRVSPNIMDYRVDSGDVLGIYIEGVLDVRDEAAIANTLPLYNPTDRELYPSIGFPVQVRDDGTLLLPNANPIPVRGLSLREIHDYILYYYTEVSGILKNDFNAPVGELPSFRGQQPRSLRQHKDHAAQDGNDPAPAFHPRDYKVFVNLQKPRMVRVLVMRQEAGNSQTNTGLTTLPGAPQFPEKRGVGRVVFLPAYRNDVANALAETGGMPGLDANNTIYVLRNRALNSPALRQHLQAGLSQRMPPPMIANLFQSHGRNRRTDATLAAIADPTMSRRNTPVIRAQSPGQQSTGGQAPGGLYSSGQDPYANAGGAWNPETNRSSQVYQAGYNTGDFAGAELSAAKSLQNADYRTTDPSPNSAPGAIEQAGWQPTPAMGQGLPPSLQPNMSPGMQPGMGSGLTAGNGSGFNGPRANGPVLNGQPQNGQPFNGPAFNGQPFAGPPMGSGFTPPGPWSAATFGPTANAAAGPYTATAGPEFDIPAEALGDLSIHNLDNPLVVRIPTRIAPGEDPGFCEDDIILNDGDMVFVDSREYDFFFTGGVMGQGQFVLPRDYDLDVVGAVLYAESQVRQFANRPTRALGGTSVLNRDVTAGASEVIVLRRMPDGTVIPIQVDLFRALRDPNERVVIQEGDTILLQYKPMEAAYAFFERYFFEGFLIGASTTFLYNRN